MIFLQHFIIGFVISFLGSMPLGMINLTTIELSLRKNWLYTLKFAFGAALVELIQAWVAIRFAYLFAENPVIERGIQALAIPVFFGLAFYYFRRRADVKITAHQTNDKKKPFWQGMLVSALNFLAVPFWVFWTFYLTGKGLLESDHLSVLILAVGVMLGTFALLTVYAGIARNLGRRWSYDKRYSGKIVSLLFLGLGIYQLIRFF